MTENGDNGQDLWSAAPRAEPLPRDPRRLLPHDLDLALKHLTDGELQRLAEAVSFETRRRRMLRDQQVVAASEEETRNCDAAKTHGLTSTQVNLIRSSIKAGVKPAALQRQFGLSKAQIAAVMKGAS